MLDGYYRISYTIDHKVYTEITLHPLETDRDFYLIEKLTPAMLTADEIKNILISDMENANYHSEIGVLEKMDDVLARIGISGDDHTRRSFWYNLADMGGIVP